MQKKKIKKFVSYMFLSGSSTKKVLLWVTRFHNLSFLSYFPVIISQQFST